MRGFWTNVALCALVGATALTVSCTNTGDNPNEQVRPEIARTPVTLSAESQAVVAGMNQFALDLYHRTRPEHGSVVMSPASISMAMGIAYRGAAGATALQMQQVMHYPGDPAATSAAFGPVQSALNVRGEHYQLTLSNRMFIRDGLPIAPDFRRDVTRDFGGGFEALKFAPDPESARRRINGWIAERTNNHIPQLVQPGMIAPDTVSMLINTVYWRGRWAETFSEGATQAAPFTRSNGQETLVQMMQQAAYFRYNEHDGVQAISLPFENANVDMVVFLPRRASGLARWEAGLSDADLRDWLRRVDASPSAKVIVKLPRFSIRQTMADVVEQLRSMGLSAPFDTATADFSGMIGAPTPRILISKILHAATIDVAENGVEATAATAMIGATAAPMHEPPPEFTADRPFLYLIRDQTTGLILFIGRYDGDMPAA